MGKTAGNCTDVKAAVTVKAFFDGTQSGQKAFMQLMRRRYRMDSPDQETNDIDKTKYSIDETQYRDYTKSSGADVGGTIVSFAEYGGQHDGF